MAETIPSRKFSFDSMFGSYILNCRRNGEYSADFDFCRLKTEMILTR